MAELVIKGMDIKVKMSGSEIISAEFVSNPYLEISSGSEVNFILISPTGDAIQDLLGNRMKKPS